MSDADSSAEIADLWQIVEALIKSVDEINESLGLLSQALAAHRETDAHVQRDLAYLHKRIDLKDKLITDLMKQVAEIDIRLPG